MAFRAVLFDLDGTLLDTLDDLADSVNAVLARRGLATHPTDSYRLFVGEGARVLVERALGAPASDARLVDSVLAEYRVEYGLRWNRRSRPYPGIPEMLDALFGRGIPLAVLSNKPDDFTKMCVRHYFPAVRFSEVAGQLPGIARKPDPAGALRIAERLALPPAQILYAGDSSVDMKTAVAAGMFPLGVLWGFRTREEILQAGARGLATEPREVLSILGR